MLNNKPFTPICGKVRGQVRCHAPAIIDMDDGTTLQTSNVVCHILEPNNSTTWIETAHTIYLIHR